MIEVKIVLYMQILPRIKAGYYSSTNGIRRSPHENKKALRSFYNKKIFLIENECKTPFKVFYFHVTKCTITLKCTITTNERRFDS